MDIFMAFKKEKKKTFDLPLESFHGKYKDAKYKAFTSHKQGSKRINPHSTKTLN
jgi:hypothetical protein